MYYERKKYTIIYDGIKDSYLSKFDWTENSLEILEPTNWKQANKKLVRNENYHGIAVTITDALIFTSEAKSVLEYILDLTGLNSIVKLKVETTNKQTDILELDYLGYIDFKTYDISESSFTVKLNSDPLTESIKSNQNSKVELERLDDLNSNEIEPLKTINLYNEGRELFQTSQCVESDELLERTYIFGFGGFINTKTILTKVKFKDDENVHETFPPSNRFTTSVIPYNNGNVNTVFYGKNDFDRTLTIDIDVDKDFIVNINNNNNPAPTVSLEVFLYKYQNGDNYDFKERVLDVDGNEVLWSWSPEDTRMTFKTTVITDLLVDESLELRYNLTAQMNFNSVKVEEGKYVNGIFTQDNLLRKVSILVSEESAREPTNHLAILGYEFAERISKISFSSEFESTTLGRTDIGYNKNGLLSDTAFAHGMWFRGMTSSFEKFKALSTSWKDFYDSLNVISPIGIETLNGIIKLEDRKHFYQDHVSIDLGEVTELNIKPDIKNNHSILNLGYEKAGGYDEKQGLDEYNRKTQYNIPIIINSILNLIAKYRTDGYGMETIRRDINDLNKDSKFDDHIWVLDVEISNILTNTYKLSNWIKRFAKPPTSVFSPDTAINLWFSPMNIILRYGSWFKGTLLKNLEDFISFNSSEGNSKLKTQLINGLEYVQNGKIQVSELDEAILNGAIGEFKAPIEFKQLTDKTNNISNFYGKCKFTFKDKNYNSYIYSVSINNGIGDFIVKTTN